MNEHQRLLDQIELAEGELAEAEFHHNYNKAAKCVARLDQLRAELRDRQQRNSQAED